ncbi:MAG TPA: alpha-E domain-containing protein [Steroidobacteraceae bacterium]|nr:alpha-E domain-containing protein [Steroidobacteraceae bacterium]
MLSRTADHLYWMSRSIERAENLARMLDARYRHELLPHAPEVLVRDWEAMLNALGLLSAYESKHGAIEPRAAFEFLCFDREHAGSIVSVLRQARENARAVRGSITSEMWETINATWLEARRYRAGSTEGGVGDFLEWVKDRSNLWRGVTLGTMLRDEAFRFTRIGTFLERADATARMLLARLPSSIEPPSVDAASADLNAWTILLRSLSAFEVYRKVYRDAVTPWRVTELLVLHAELPRSLRRSMNELHSGLAAVANEQSRETERRAGELQAQLHFGRLDDLTRTGTQRFLVSFLARLNDLADRIAQDFLVPVGE